MSIRIDLELENFVIDHFDSEESLLLVLALRSEPSRPWTASQVVTHLRDHFPGSIADEESKLTERRIELRLRELEQKSIVRSASDTRPPAFAYALNAADDARVASVERLFRADKFAINRIIYGVASRARVLADAFRL